MLIPIFTLFVLSSIVWLVLGIRGRKEDALLVLDSFWWLGSLVSAYFAFLAWQDRMFSENWAMMGFLFGSLPYSAIVGTMVVAELVFIRKWQSNKARAMRLMSAGLLMFSLFQVTVGLLSARP
jgi:hypothetical protein